MCGPQQYEVAQIGTKEIDAFFAAPGDKLVDIPFDRLRMKPGPGAKSSASAPGVRRVVAGGHRSHQAQD